LKIEDVWIRLINQLINRFGGSPNVLSAIEASSQRLQGKGWGSKTVFEEAEAALERLSAPRNKPIQVIDIGANVGNYSKAILDLAPNARIYAFEPSEVARFELLRRFENENRIQIFPFAVGAAERNQLLWSNVPGSGLGSLIKRDLRHFGIDFSFTEEVRVLTLDSWNSGFGIKPDIIKIDVEGFELDVLKGARGVVKNTKVIQFEFGGCNIDTKTFFRDFYNFFTELNFKLYRISKNGLIEIKNYSERDETFLVTNYLAVNSSSSH
jgi:FkbM family methyltransferase